MLNQWPNLVVTGKSSDLLVVVAFVTEQNVDGLGVAFDQRWSDLTIVFSCRRHVQIENCVHFRIYQQRHFELLNREFSPFRVMF
ncbi:hypothetical protein HALDL1_00295 (plasmid) [Halobacterium sp. DL1]|nr:hypothetical protein HALDL1_00295 [Halobacterium sp. DL1]